MRAQDKGIGELGLFARDADFVRESLRQMTQLTGNAFSYKSVQAFTFSNGMFDFNRFLKTIGSSFNVTRVISMDPRFAIRALRPSPSTVMKQYVSLTTGGAPGPEFEKLPYGRWKNEYRYPAFEKQRSKFQYLHNHTLPKYTLSLGLRK